MTNIPHDSASKHVSGESVYIDDMLVNEQLLHGHILYSPHAHARIKSIDTSAAKKLPGVYAVLTAKDIPCLLYTSPSPRDRTRSRMPSSA